MRRMNLMMYVAGQLIGIHSEMEACRICRIVLNDRQKDIDCLDATDKRTSPKRNGVSKKGETHAQHRTMCICWKLVASVDSCFLKIRKRTGEHRQKETVTHNPVETFHKLKRLEKRFQLFH
jgi:hypothetical protein